MAVPFDPIWSGDADLSGTDSSGNVCLVVVETGESATTEGVADETGFGVEVDVDLDRTVMLGRTFSELTLDLASAGDDAGPTDDEEAEAELAAAAAFADLEAARTEAEGVANGVLTLTTGEAAAVDPDETAAADGAGNVVKVGFDKLDRLNTLALRLIGG